MAKLRENFWAELIFTEEKIRSLCEEWLNYLGTLYFAFDPSKGPQSPPSLIWPGDTQNLISDSHIVIVLILSAPNLPFQEESLLPCPPAPTHTFCLVTEHCLSFFHTREQPCLRCSAPPSLSDTLPVIHRLILCHTVPSTPRQFVTPSSRLP